MLKNWRQNSKTDNTDVCDELRDGEWESVQSEWKGESWALSLRRPLHTALCERKGHVRTCSNKTKKDLVLDCSKGYLDQVQTNLINFNPIWSSLNQFDLFWSTLIQFDPIWTSLINLDQVQTNLMHFDHVWTSLNKFDPVWTCLNKFDQFGSSLNQYDQKGVTKTLNQDKWRQRQHCKS